MEISVELIKQVREKTGAGIVECKSVLQETGGDVEKAIDVLKKKGLAKADKKAGREAKEGIAAFKVDGNRGLVLKVNCETDFVAKTADFKNFVEEVKEKIFAGNYKFDGKLPEELEEMRRNMVAKVGENILISEWKFIDGKGKLFPYVHLSKVAAIMDYQVSSPVNGVDEFVKKLAMQITAMNPQSVTVDDLPEEVLKPLKEQFYEEARQSQKPERIIESIVQGKLQKFYEEAVLYEQNFILDEEKKVKDVIREFEKNNGVSFKVNGFVRVSL